MLLLNFEIIIPIQMAFYLFFFNHYVLYHLVYTECGVLKMALNLFKDLRYSQKLKIDKYFELF